MWRLAGWLIVLALALAGHVLDSAALRLACVFAALAIIAWNAPRALRAPLAACALAALLLACWRGPALLLDAVPALIAAFVAALFARTLRAARRPLIARAIAALDGEAPLQDAAVARYARRLTAVWACYQAALALLGLLLAGLATSDALPPGWPSPRLFGAVLLPLAVAALLLGEFALRRWLLPQAPRHRLDVFLLGLVRAWPALLAD